jgi:hypothetical protein
MPNLDYRGAAAALRESAKSKKELEVVLVPRNETIAEWIQQCADGKLNFGELCARVSELGYKTTSLYEMVRSMEGSRGK